MILHDHVACTREKNQLWWDQQKGIYKSIIKKIY